MDARALRAGILDLLTGVSIDTKEAGRTHITPWMSQLMLIDAVAKGLASGVHEFVVLKCRQVAITTTCSVIELFWALANPGVQGAIIADRTDNLERLRRIFANLIETLPPEWRDPSHRLVTNNRNSMVFANKSVIDLLAAASNPDLGASRAINMGHFTECALWKSMAGVESLRASLARENPRRLYVFESTANGFNWFYEYCQQAKRDRRMKFLFIGFWAQPTYSIPKSDPDYKTYWDGTLTEEELKNVRYVKQEYGHIVKPEQIAWHRREGEFRSQDYMMRHYPFHEKECFIASGSSFFPGARTLQLSEALAAGPPYQAYKYTFTEKFLESEISQVYDTDEAMLRVYEAPDPNGVYAVGCDPSGGGGDTADDHAVQVLRCYADRVVQVAEFQSNRPLTYQFAWVLAHLCGAYKQHICNLEVTGIGGAVIPEIRNLRQLADMGLMNAVPGFEDSIKALIGNVRWFLYTRIDTMSGAGSVQHWKTNHDNKAMIYSALRDSMMLSRVEVRSVRLMRQLQGIVEDAGYIGAGADSAEGDDLVSALVLAHWAWVQWQRPPLEARGWTYDALMGERPPQDAANVLSQAYTDFWRGLNRRRRVGAQPF
jgi:hypothetical protein